MFKVDNKHCWKDYFTHKLVPDQNNSQMNKETHILASKLYSCLLIMHSFISDDGLLTEW